MTAAGVRHWLLTLNLPEQYEALLLTGGYNTLANCEQLNDAVLEQIGIKAVGHRRRILSHLPSNVTEMSEVAAYESEEDDREVYDIPPVARRPGIMSKQESTYTNIVEMNEILKPSLPPKKRLSSVEEMDARLGIISPPVKPFLGHGIFSTSSSSTDVVRTKPKLCVVRPEKRPPVPTRRISKDLTASAVIAENRLNNNVEPRVLQKAPVTATVAPVARSRTFLGQQDTISEDDSKSDTVPVDNHKFSEPRVTAADNIGTFLHSESVDSAPKPSLRYNAGSANSVLQTKKLSSGLESDLQEFVSSTKKSVLRKVDPGTHTASNSCGTSVEQTTMVEQTTKVERTTSDCRENINVETTDSECVYVISDDAPITGHLSQLSSHQNQGLGQLTHREKTEPKDELVYEVSDVTATDDHDTDERESPECRYSPPSFPPPPLPADFAPHGMFDFSAYLKSNSVNQEPPSRTDTNITGTLGFADFAEESVKQRNSVKPQAPPRRRKSTVDVVDDKGLSPLAAGFSKALDDYFTGKEVLLTDWMNQPSECLSIVGDVSNSHFEPFADLRPPEPLSETTEDVNCTKQSVIQFDSNEHCLSPVSEASDYEFWETMEAVDDAAVSKTKESPYVNVPGIVKRHNADGSKAVACSKETGD